MLILDSLPAHKGKAVNNYVEFRPVESWNCTSCRAMRRNSIQDELVWNYMKRTGTARSPLKKGDSLHDRIDEQLFPNQMESRLVRSFFKAEDVSYISD